MGTFLHTYDVAQHGIPPRQGGASRTFQDVVEHITHGTNNSACISLTKSYAIAVGYAKGFGRAFPTATSPAHVYVIDIPDNRIPGIFVFDPVAYIATAPSVRNPFASPSYHHDSDKNFLLGVVDPVRFGNHITATVAQPGSGATPRGGRLTLELEALVRALRDAEVLVVGHIPASCVKRRYDVS